MNAEQKALSCCKVVLIGTTHEGNIGAAARAMKVMGISRLALVAPQIRPGPIAHARASGADDILQQAQIVDHLADALHGVHCSLAFSARRREWSLAPQSLRQAVQANSHLPAQGEHIALVFGAEHSGLDNASLQQCTQPVYIPTASTFSSLNLAAAVQLACYELRQAILAANQTPLPPANPQKKKLARHQPATHQAIEGFYQQLFDAMSASGFLDPQNPGQLLARVRRLFGRIHLEREEVNILRGFLNALQHGSKKPPSQPPSAG